MASGVGRVASGPVGRKAEALWIRLTFHRRSEFAEWAFNWVVPDKLLSTNARRQDFHCLSGILIPLLISACTSQTSLLTINLHLQNPALLVHS